MSKTDQELEERLPDPKLLLKLIQEDVPVLRHFYFTFLITDMPIAFREQLVRSQFDHYWIQSGRITNWTTADYERRDLHDGVLNELQDQALEGIQEFIQRAHHRGVPPEDYRHLIPVGAMHRGVWTANLQSILQRLRKRSCWIAQSEYWTSVLDQVKQEIERVLKVTIPIRPPCMDHKGYKACPMSETMKDRIFGSDPLSPCPLYLLREGSTLDFLADDDLIPPKDVQLYDSVMIDEAERVKSYERLWNLELPRRRY